MRVGLPTGVVRSSVDETITGLWSFLNALGFRTDVITERTAAAGVTIDGLLVKDSGIPAAVVTAHQAALSLLFTQLTDSIVAGQVPVGVVAQHQAALAIAFTQLTSSIADAQVPASAVTQHQAALAIAFTQLSGQIADAQVPASAVTQHEAALAIFESQIADGSILARLTAAETIAGAWTFTPRTNFPGGIDARSAASPTAPMFLTDVIGDGSTRFVFDASGLHEWGPGNAGVDTQLGREGVGELGTPGDFNVGGTLDLGADLELSERNMTLSGGVDDDDVDTGTVTVQRLDPNGTSNIRGFAGGRPGRVIVVCNITGAGVGILSDNAGSIAANRILGPGNANFTLDSRDSVQFWYDSTTSRWRTISLNV